MYDALRIIARLASLATGGTSVFSAFYLFTTYPSRYSTKLALLVCFFAAASFFLLWLSSLIESHQPPRKRGKSLLDRLLVLLD